MEDKFVLGGKEFKSRFILGSGKYNLNRSKLQLSREVQKSSPLLSDVPILRRKKIYLISFRKE